MVRDYKGSHSGEHGDGIVRSEFHEPMFGTRLVRAFEQVKERFDPRRRTQSGQDRPRAAHGRPRAVPLPAGVPGGRPQDGARLVRVSRSGRRVPGRRRDVQQQRRLPEAQGGVMCPSYMATRNERDVTRGRANTLRLAISGQLGPDAFTSDGVMEALKLCVSCKGCRRECPTGVDMAKMKIEVLAARAEKYGLSVRSVLSPTCPATPERLGHWRRSPTCATAAAPCDG